jgi:hypothetical protein
VNENSHVHAQAPSLHFTFLKTPTSDRARQKDFSHFSLPRLRHLSPCWKEPRAFPHLPYFLLHTILFLVYTNPAYYTYVHYLSLRSVISLFVNAPLSQYQRQE